MDKPRFLLAIVLSVAVLVLWAILFPAPRRPAPSSAAPTAAEEAPPSRSVPAESAPAPRVPGVAGLLAGPSEDFVFETNELRIDLSGRGAVARQIRLKRFYPDAASERRASDKVEDWLALLRAPERGPATFGLRDHAGSLGFDLDQAPWAFALLSSDGALLARCPLSNRLTFEKEFRPGAHPFTLEIVLRVTNEDPDAVGRDLLLAFSPTSSIFPYGDSFYKDPVALAGCRKGYSLETENVVANPTGNGEPRPFPAGEIAWGGSMNKYFAALARPLPPARFAFARAVPLADPGAPPTARWRLLAAECGLSFHLQPAGQVEEKRLEVFVGPKRPGVLRAAEPTYDRAFRLDYGWAGWVSRPLLWILGLFHSLTGSWGVSILLLTLVVRGALFPLNRHQQVAMARFQERARKLQPQVEEIKRKYKNDFRKLQQAQGQLFREHGLRFPAFGCLTMFFQLPVWWGLFSALRVSYELRHAPFLWIEDLSRPDQTLSFGSAIPFLGWTHLNLLPLAMMVVWWLQQRMAPKPADPQQAAQMKVLQFMPFLFGFMFYNYAAGLSLYWLASSSLGIVESKIIRRQAGLPVRSPSPTG
ncbi:MAG TPA: membrane protein insertase YidC [Planctomycetota bacterium]|nr:membrane protein insertase YidC [Planctomycetota bacterium]